MHLAFHVHCPSFWREGSFCGFDWRKRTTNQNRIATMTMMKSSIETLRLSMTDTWDNVKTKICCVELNAFCQRIIDISSLQRITLTAIWYCVMLNFHIQISIFCLKLCVFDNTKQIDHFLASFCSCCTSFFLVFVDFFKFTTKWKFHDITQGNFTRKSIYCK